MDETRAQKLTQEWMLEHDMLETDTSMMTVTCYNWKVMLENYRVRGIDTTFLTDEENGIAGIPYPGGNYMPTCVRKPPPRIPLSTTALKTVLKIFVSY